MVVVDVVIAWLHGGTPSARSMPVVDPGNIPVALGNRRDCHSEAGSIHQDTWAEAAGIQDQVRSHSLGDTLAVVHTQAEAEGRMGIVVGRIAVGRMVAVVVVVGHVAGNPYRTSHHHRVSRLPPHHHQSKKCRPRHC